MVELKSQDFTGLGFTICGNMKEGIYIRDILHRGPAFESGKLNPGTAKKLKMFKILSIGVSGDRINSVTISFEHMVYEDALNILSYASPYEVIIEAKGSRMMTFTQGQGQTPVHPIYRSSSLVDLLYVGLLKLWVFFFSDTSLFSRRNQPKRNCMQTIIRQAPTTPASKSPAAT